LGCSRIVVVAIALSSVADYNNNRVVYFAWGSTTASRVWGQAGNLTTAIANLNGFSAVSLNGPKAVALSNGQLLICDSNNNRVVLFPGANATPTQIWGDGTGPEGWSVTTALWDTISAGQMSANTLLSRLSNVESLSGTSSAVSQLNSALSFVNLASKTLSLEAARQSFMTITSTGVASASLIAQPYGIALDSSGGMYVADHSAHRVLYFPYGTTTASRVYGQGGSFTANTPNNGGISANSLLFPGAVTVDSTNGIYGTLNLNSEVRF
jgi:hypothetical protein